VGASDATNSGIPAQSTAVTGGDPVQQVVITGNQLPATASDSQIRSDVQAIASSPNVAPNIMNAWANSNPNAPPVPAGTEGSTKVEQGAWIVQNSDGSYTYVPMPSGTRGSLPDFTMPPPDTVAFFHTHPNTYDEGYEYGPSRNDNNFVNNPAINVPGIIISHNGMYYYGPPVPSTNSSNGKQ